MPSDFMPWMWLVMGLALIASELFHASLTALFLGAGAIIIALLQGLGVVDGLAMSLVLWACASLGLAVPLRPVVRRYLPGERKYDPSDEDRNAYGTIVSVVEMVREGDCKGRVRFHGTTWPATTLGDSIPAGGKARLVYREKLAWIVEAASEDELAPVDDAEL